MRMGVAGFTKYYYEYIFPVSLRLAGSSDKQRSRIALLKASDWWKWLKTNSVRLIGADPLYYYLRNSNIEIRELKSSDCSEKDIKNALDRILKIYLSNSHNTHRVDGLSLPFYKLDDPIMCITEHLAKRRKDNDFKKALSEGPVVQSISVLGGGRLYDYWCKRLNDLGLLSNTESMLLSL